MCLNIRHCVFIWQIKFLMSYISLSVCTDQVTQTEDSINNVCPFHFRDHTLPAWSSFEWAIVRHREVSWLQGAFKGSCVCVCVYVVSRSLENPLPPLYGNVSDHPVSSAAWVHVMCVRKCVCVCGQLVLEFTEMFLCVFDV